MIKKRKNEKRLQLLARRSRAGPAPATRRSGPGAARTAAPVTGWRSAPATRRRPAASPITPIAESATAAPVSVRKWTSTRRQNDRYIYLLPIDLSAIHVFDSLFCLFACVKFDECKPFRQIVVMTIEWHVHRFDGSVSRKYLLHMVFRYVSRQMIHAYFRDFRSRTPAAPPARTGRSAP